MSLDTGAYWEATFAMQNSGDFWSTVKVNLWEGQLASLAWAWDHGRIFQTAGLFMAGMLIGRQGWFHKENLKYWGRALAIALVCFFPLHGLNAMAGDYITNPNLKTSLLILVSSLANLSFLTAR